MSDEGFSFVAFGNKLPVTESWARSALETLSGTLPTEDEELALVALSINSDLVYFGWTSDKLVHDLLISLQNIEIAEKKRRKKEFNRELDERSTYKTIEDDFRVFVQANTEKLDNDYSIYREERRECGKKPSSKTKWLNTLKKTWIKSRLQMLYREKS